MTTQRNGGRWERSCPFNESYIEDILVRRTFHLDDFVLHVFWNHVLVTICLFPRSSWYQTDALFFLQAHTHGHLFHSVFTLPRKSLKVSSGSVWELSKRAQECALTLHNGFFYREFWSLCSFYSTSTLLCLSASIFYGPMTGEKIKNWIYYLFHVLLLSFSQNSPLTSFCRGSCLRLPSLLLESPLQPVPSSVIFLVLDLVSWLAVNFDLFPLFI